MRSSSGYAAVVAVVAHDPSPASRIGRMASADSRAPTARPPTRPSSQRLAGTRAVRIERSSAMKTSG